MIQCIDLEGNLVAGDFTPDKDRCMELFRWMLYVRNFDEQVLSLQRAGRISFCNPSTGQEASQIGTAAALSMDDWVFPSYRVAGVYLYRRRSPLPLLNQLYGNAADLSRGRQLPMHFGDKSVNFVSVSSPVGTQITQAVGVSFAAKMRSKPIVAITYFSDGGTSTNDFHAGLNLAGVLKTPTIFYCENNQYALSVPVHRQTASVSIAAKGAAYGIDSLQIDGNDVFAVYTTVTRVAESLRAGHGPFLLEAITYRRGLHSSSDEPSLYRNAEKEAEWSSNDPIERCRKFLKKQGWWSSNWETEVHKEQLATIQDAIIEAEETPVPEPATLFEDVWAVTPPRLEAQRRRFSQELLVNESDTADFKFPI